mgnify:CR=1 FL=1
MKNINWKKVGFYVALGFMSLIFFTSGIGKLISMEDWLVEWDIYGYPLWFMYVIGVLQVVGTVLLWVPKTRIYAAAMFIIIMIGAAFTHVAVGEFLPIIQNVILIVLSGFVILIGRESLPFLNTAT